MWKPSPYERGVEAARNGVPISDNPYARMAYDNNWWEWRQGHDSITEANSKEATPSDQETPQ